MRRLGPRAFAFVTVLIADVVVAIMVTAAVATPFFLWPDQLGFLARHDGSEDHILADLAFVAAWR
jgi:hypothetical protein